MRAAKVWWVWHLSVRIQLFIPANTQWSRETTTSKYLDRLKAKYEGGYGQY